jgi:hypothetical protein
LDSLIAEKEAELEIASKKRGALTTTAGAGGASSMASNFPSYPSQQAIVPRDPTGQTKINGYFTSSASSSALPTNNNQRQVGDFNFNDGFNHQGAGGSVPAGRPMMSSWDDTADRIAQRANAQYVPSNSGNGYDNGDNGNGSSSWFNNNYGSGGGGARDDGNNYMNNSAVVNYGGYDGNNYGDGYNDNSNNPQCMCGVPSILKTSFTEKNYNRKFFCCANRRKSDNDGTSGVGVGYDGCDFFEWEDGVKGSSGPSGAGFVQTEGYRDHNVEISRIFGHEGFRLGQKECVEAALQGRDVFCLMPTGGGKSVVYQVR